MTISDEMVEAGARALWKSSIYQGYNRETQEREWDRMSGIWRNQVRSILTAALQGSVVVPAEPVGWFNPWNDYHGIQQVAVEYEGGSHVYPLYCHPEDRKLVQLPDSYSSVSRQERDAATGGGS